VLIKGRGSVPQIFENYGQPSYVYFTYHGFVLANNTHDCLQLHVAVAPEDPAFQDLPLLSQTLERRGFGR
jgi:hypothetical protein